MRALFFLYSLAIEVAVWTMLAPAVWVRALVTPRGTVELRERLARAPHRDAATRPTIGPVLVHAVSVGEMRAAAPLVTALAAKSQRVALTAGTSAGLEAARRIARTEPSVDSVSYLPWDRPAVRKWIAHLAPSAVVVVETEIWPNLFRACADLQIPLVIANGRIRPADVWKYRLLRAFFAHVLDSAVWIGVQSAAERDRFLAIGATPERVEIAGNLKFDAALVPSVESALHMPDARARPLIVAGSTHGPEERWLLECARLLEAEGHPIRLVLAPRDIARAGRVARRAQLNGCRVRLWSSFTGAECDVLVLDQFATLHACYASADVVVIGGTFAPVGGHNLLEPAAFGRPILVGPHTDEIAAVVQVFADAGALMRVTGTEPARALADACRSLFADPVRARTMGERAAAVCKQRAGSTARYVDVVVERVAAVATKMAASNMHVEAADAANVATPSHG